MVAASDEALGKGALLIFNDEIHAAAEVTKTHTTSCATFHSPGWGPIGHIYFDRVVFRRQPLNLEKNLSGSAGRRGLFAENLCGDGCVFI